MQDELHAAHERIASLNDTVAALSSEGLQLRQRCTDLDSECADLHRDLSDRTVCFAICDASALMCCSEICRRSMRG